jgi:hypothetical protein
MHICLYDSIEQCLSYFDVTNASSWNHEQHGSALYAYFSYLAVPVAVCVETGKRWVQHFVTLSLERLRKASKILLNGIVRSDYIDNNIRY